MHLMMKIIRFVVLSALWLFVYLKTVHLFFLKVWNFNIFNSSGWDKIPAEWKNGLIIDTPSEFFFFFSIFMIVPAFAFTLFLLFRVPWHRFYKDIFSSISEKKKARHRRKMDSFPDGEELAKILLEKANSKGTMIGKDKMPPKMDAIPSLGSKARAATKAKTNKQKDSLVVSSPDSVSVSKSSPPSSDITSPEKLPEPKLVSRVDVKYEVISLAEKNSLRLVQDLKIGKDIVDFAFIAKGIIYLVNLEPNGSEWIADEMGFENDEPLWFSETKYESSPVFKLERSLQTLSPILNEMLADSGEKVEVKKMFLIGGCNILNYEDIKDTWQEQEVSVYRLSNGEPKEVPELSSLMPVLSEKKDNSPEITERIYTAFVCAES